jgi:hypothetical protein
MVKEVKLKNTKSHLKLMNKLWMEFPQWSIKNMGTLKSVPNSVHYHIQSKRKDETGTIEIILAPDKRDRILLKIAKNRKGNWATRAKKDLSRYLV